MELLRYLTKSSKDVFGEWLASVRDVRARARIAARLTRLAVGNFGDCKPLQEGVWELRIDFGPGYRVYYAMIDRSRVLLLYGSEKRRQSSAIERAVGYWKDFKRRIGK